MGIFKPEFNVPATIALKFPDGIEVDSQFGKPQVMYTLWNDDKYYADMAAANAIAAAGVRPLQEFSICKRQVQDGRKKSVAYEISFPGQGGSNLPVPVPSAFTATTTRNQPTSVPQIPQATHTPRPIPTQLGYKAAMTNCLILAIESTHDAEAHAMAKGYSVRFAENAIQDIASTLFIQAARQNFVTWDGRID